jgi:nucleoid-associated protein YgaU
VASGSPLASGVERAILEGAGLVVPLGLSPTSLSIRRNTQWQAPSSRSPGAAQPASAVLGQSGGTVPVGHGQLQFTRSQPAVLSMVVWFDRSFDADGSIDYEINQLQNWTCPTERITSGVQSPPRITFIWRSLHFVGVITSLNIKYKQFGVDGLPVRAEASISITENPSPLPFTNPTSGGISGRRVHTFSAGDTLHSVAYTEYGNPGLWRVLAEANGVDDPLRITPGTALLIPPDPHSGGPG